MKIIATNKKAYHDYEIFETLEAGLVLTGDEVKSIRAGHISLKESYVTVHRGELMLINCHIAPYSHAYQRGEDLSRRTRKLLLHKKEVSKLIGSIAKKGLTIMPLKVYLNKRGYIKVEIGLARHKKAAGKKRELRERDIKRDTEREIKGRLR